MTGAFVLILVVAAVALVAKLFYTVNNGKETGPGPLTKENVSIGEIHLGDSQEQVLKLYGQPGKITTLHSAK